MSSMLLNPRTTGTSRHVIWNEEPDYVPVETSYITDDTTIYTKYFKFYNPNCSETTSTSTNCTYIEYTQMNAALGARFYYTHTSTASTISNCYMAIQPVSIGDKIREIIRANMSPVFTRRRYSHIQSAADEREIRARETLRHIIGEQDYNRFLRRGFVSVRAKSGRLYVIYPGHSLTGVYEDGKLIERLCGDLQGGFTPTDSLLTRYCLILYDEDQFRSRCNVTPVANSIPTNGGVRLLTAEHNKLRLVDHFAEAKKRIFELNQRPSKNILIA